MKKYENNSDCLKTRCCWVNTDPLYIHYHDDEWGVPLYDDQQLFELLVLEGMQAGLSWITILKKREYYRLAFANFDVEKIIQYDEKKLSQLLLNPNIIRNRLKIAAIVNNAHAYLNLKQKYLSFSNYLWQFVDGKPIQNHFEHASQIPAYTSVSDKMSKDLKHNGFKFVGSTICYAFMQAAGMVNDHTIDCFRYNELL